MSAGWCCACRKGTADCWLYVNGWDWCYLFLVIHLIHAKVPRCWIVQGVHMKPPTKLEIDFDERKKKMGTGRERLSYGLSSFFFQGSIAWSRLIR